MSIFNHHLIDIELTGLILLISLILRIKQSSNFNFGKKIFLHFMKGVLCLENQYQLLG